MVGLGICAPIVAIFSLLCRKGNENIKACLRNSWVNDQALSFMSLCYPMASSKQKEVIQCLGILVACGALRVKYAIWLEQELKSFRPVITSVVQMDTISKWYGRVRVLANIGKRTTIIVYFLAFLLWLELPLSLMIFEVLKRFEISCINFLQIAREFLGL